MNPATKWVVVLAAGLAALATGFRVATKDADAAPEETDDIAGTVVHAGTKAPLAGATVALWRRDQSLGGAPADSDRALDLDWPARPARSAATDPQGRFSFSKEARAPARWLTVSAVGFATTVFDAAKAPPARLLLTPTKLIRVRCVRRDQLGDEHPVAGAEVLLFPASDRGPLGARFTTGPDGRVALPAMPDADALVRAKGIAVTRLHLGDEDDEIRRFCEPGGAVSGVVTGPAGEPIAGARLHIRWGVALGAATDAMGGFRIDGVGCFRDAEDLSVEADGFLRHTSKVFGGDDALRIVLARPLVVKGRVVSSTGEPMEGVSVEHIDASQIRDGRLDGPRDPSHAEEPPKTDANGRFELKDVGPSLRVIVLHDASAGPILARTVDVPPSGAPLDLALSVRPPIPWIVVRVVDDEGKPVAGVEVSDAGGGLKSAHTGADGTARIPVLAMLGSDVKLTGGPVGRAKLSVSLPAAAVATGAADVVLGATAELTIRVLRPDGTPVPRGKAIVAVALVAGPPLACDAAVIGYTDEGFLKVRVPRNRPFVVTAAPTGEPLVPHRAVHRFDETKDGVLDVALARGASVKAKWSFPENARHVALLPEGGVDLLAGRAMVPGEVKDGVLRVSAVPKGTWTLVAGGEISYLVARRVVVPAEGEVDLGVLSGTAVLRGKVTCLGRPVAGATVGIRIEEGHDMSTRALPDGSYALRVPVGAEGRLFARRSGYGMTSAPFKVAADATADLALAAEGRLLLRNAAAAIAPRRHVRVRAVGMQQWVMPLELTGDAVIGELPPGPVEIFATAADGTGDRVVRAEAVAGKTVEVDLAPSK